MAYGVQLYGTLLYTEESPTVGEIEPFIPDLLKYMPQYVRKDPITVQVQKAIAKRVGLIEFTIDDTMEQFSIDTATWGLDIYEKELGLETDQTKPFARRREIVKAKIRGSGTTTKTLIKNTAAAFSGGDVDVVEFPTEYRFEVQFVGTLGIPPNMAGFLAMLDEIKPAFMTYTIKYTFSTWNMVDGLTWNGASAQTWNQLRTFQGA